MKATFFLLTVLALCFGIRNVQAQNKTDNKQQYASLGNFDLENGQKILDCQIGYRTFGKLNTDKSNAIIYLCGFGDNSAELQTFIPGNVVDTAKFYLILIDALGNGYSSSPSISTKQPGLQFPQFSIQDMVESRYKMLTEKMNIRHLVAVCGASMGGIQSFQWAVSHADFMDKVLPLLGTPQLASSDLLWSNTHLQAIKRDTAYHNGNYKGEPTLEVASHIAQLVSSTPEYIINQVPRENFYNWYKAAEKQVILFDWNNQVRQLQAIIGHDIAKTTNGSLENAAKKIRAEMLIVTSKQDHAINPILPTKFASMVNAQLITIDNNSGHSTNELPLAAMRKFLEK